VTLSFGTLFRAVLDTSFLFNVDCLLLEHLHQPVCLADGWCWFVLRETYCWLIAGGWFVLREKYYWLVADKPNEQGARVS
jgi:hypothetical protein